MRAGSWGIAVVGVALVGIAVAAGTKRLDDTARGKELYERHCVQCHGMSGKGDGAAAAAMVAKVPDLSGKLTEDNRDDKATIVLDGKGPMPGYAQSFDRYDARRALRYVEKLTTGDLPPESLPFAKKASSASKKRGAKAESPADSPEPTNPEEGANPEGPEPEVVGPEDP